MKQVLFSMAIGNVALVHECFPKHLRMANKEWNTANNQKKNRMDLGVMKEKSKEGKKK